MMIGQNSYQVLGLWNRKTGISEGEGSGAGARKGQGRRAIALSQAREAGDSNSIILLPPPRPYAQHWTMMKNILNFNQKETPFRKCFVKKQWKPFKFHVKTHSHHMAIVFRQTRYQGVVVYSDAFFYLVHPHLYSVPVG